jgi:CheY-like chemotaxis protein
MATQRLKIILVDDDEDDRSLFSEALSDLKLDVTFIMFENGLNLIDYLKQADNFLATHIFLDLNMPILSGMDCLKKLREFTSKTNPFVTIYSTSSSPLDLEEAYKNGANDYLQKPNCYTTLKNSLHKSILHTPTNG